MIQNKFGELVFDENDLVDLVMQGHDIKEIKRATISPEVDMDFLASIIDQPENLLTWGRAAPDSLSVEEFDANNQAQWYMPDEYKNLDIAAHLLDLCNTQEQLQRVGEELLMYQERNLFDLLRYLKYLVDTLQKHSVIWGVGRGSSVASYVLYLLGVHRIDSLYYDLDPHEFLR